MARKVQTTETAEAPDFHLLDEAPEGVEVVSGKGARGSKFDTDFWNAIADKATDGTTRYFQAADEAAKDRHVAALRWHARERGMSCRVKNTNTPGTFAFVFGTRIVRSRKNAE